MSLKAYLQSKFTKLDRGGFVPKSKSLKLATLSISIALALICPGSLFVVIVFACAPRILYACKTCASHLIGYHEDDRQPRTKGKDNQP
jgi:hypothetical protein